MNPAKSVVIIGGGIAGLAAAVFLAGKGIKITLLESSPKLGGRAYSYFDNEKKMFFDNGQHILAGWYENTFEFLKLTGRIDKLKFQNTLEADFIDTNSKRYKLKCPDVKAPYNLFYGLMKFEKFGIHDRISLINLRRLMKLDNETVENYRSVSELLDYLKQSENLLKYFWKPFCLAVFNTELNKISPVIFLNVLRQGFSNKENSRLVLPETDLNSLLVNGAVEFLKGKDADIRLSKRVSEIKTSDKADYAELEGRDRVYGDYFISAVPFFSFKKLFTEKVYAENNFASENLKSSGIISIHLFFEKSIDNYYSENKLNVMTGLIGTEIQWLFKKGSNHLSLVISGADESGIMEKENTELYETAIKDLKKTMPGIMNYVISGYKIIKEKRATFIPDIESDKYRQPQRTGYNNFFVTGDWTDTGLPSTIESAVKSAKICSEIILKKEKIK